MLTPTRCPLQSLQPHLDVRKQLLGHMVICSLTRLEVLEKQRFSSSLIQCVGLRQAHFSLNIASHRGQKHLGARGCSWLGVFSSRRSFQMCSGLYVHCPLLLDLGSFCIKSIASHWGISWTLVCFSLLFFLIYKYVYRNKQYFSKLCL